MTDRVDVLIRNLKFMASAAAQGGYQSDEEIDDSYKILNDGIRALAAENKRLTHVGAKYQSRITGLEMENERLRGLLKEAQPYVRAGHQFDYDNELADNLAASSLLVVNIAAALKEGKRQCM